MVARLFADDTVLLTDSERELQKVIDGFYRVCVRRKLGVNAGICKVMVFEREEVKVLDVSMCVHHIGLMCQYQKVVR